MNIDDVKRRAYAMPLTSPAFPPDPVAQLPVLEVVSGVHIVSDLTLGLGTVIHDYLS